MRFGTAGDTTHFRMRNATIGFVGALAVMCALALIPNAAHGSVVSKSGTTLVITGDGNWAPTGGVMDNDITITRDVDGNGDPTGPYLISDAGIDDLVRRHRRRGERHDLQPRPAAAARPCSTK